MSEVKKTLEDNDRISFTYPEGFEQVQNSFEGMTPEEVKGLLEGFILSLPFLV